MRTLSFILALGVILAGPSIAGSLESGLPGVGTFSYNGAAITAAAPQSILIAARNVAATVR
jgi:hypothetical protein